ncbi:MAG: hypothetical protein ACKO9H_01440 [Planctomycetota bacterium]|jgi:hypothetical protein
MAETEPYRVLDREFLEARARILELGAIFDRMDRSGTADANDPRLEKLRTALRCVLESSGAAGVASRAEQVQLIFSRQYDEQWRKNFGI